MSFRGGRGRGRGGGSRYGGPRLPSTLIDEVNATYGTSHRQTGVRARKDARKEARRGGQRPQQGRPQTQPNRRQVESDDEDDEPAPPPPSAKAKGKRRISPEAEPEPEPARKKSKSKSAFKDEDEDEEDAPESSRKDKGKKKKKEIVLPGEDAGDAEDGEIAWLEYMLANEKKGDDELSDGLDDLLGFADKLGPGGKGLARGEVSDDDDDSDLDGSFGGGLEFDIGSDQEVDLDEDEDGSDDGEDEEESSEDDEDDDEDDGDDESEDADEDEEESEEVEPEITAVADTPAPDAAPEAPVAGRYIPPHLRAAALAEKSAGDGAKALERIKLERKAQGLLNKLSEANIESILAEIEKLFSDYSRNEVTSTITTLVIQMIGAKANLLDSFVVLYATLIGALHRVVGIEFGAHFVQTLVKKFHALAESNAGATSTAAEQDDDETDAAKEAFNLLTLIAELYNSGVIGAGLIYDLIRGYIDDVMAERSVEGLLKILKCCGSQLRSDDPASLKDIVGLVQERTRGKEKEMSTRAKFLVETMVNVRNGKTKGLGAERDDVARMRRFLSGLGKKRRLLAPEPLRVGLQDLLNADARGRWWIVGAGWSGNPLVEKAAELAAAGKPVKEKKTDREDEEVLLELARKQGMNTDVRRSVFVVLLTSEDYVHACDRLDAFRLTDVQQREFVRVTLHCCGMEKAYNPYYTLVLNNLCANSYDHRFTLQYALWDLLRELHDGSVTDHRAANVAKTLAFLVGRGSIDLTILKAVDFTDLSKGTRKFLNALLRGVLVATQTPSPLLTLPKAFNPKKNTDIEVIEEVFDRTLSNPELAGGLAWVMQSIQKTPGTGTGEREAEVIKLGSAAAIGVLARAI